ncbi:hypothetical protein [Tychonema sp. BBK16]|uniref:hypothetical protein n=1 Tax=Tychonema sp. BBK16 TaxID=2699888 RepID=UPI001F210F89|nr:hypothetical protein [Tychonema sp. BBK16]MCF6375097.1 hypothetical protein [Tychonema sp. BBK16]
MSLLSLLEVRFLAIATLPYLTPKATFVSFLLWGAVAAPIQLKPKSSESDGLPRQTQVIR